MPLLLAHDPLVARLCGLAHIPSGRTVGNWLKHFTQAALQAVITLNSALGVRNISIRIPLVPLIFSK